MVAIQKDHVLGNCIALCSVTELAGGRLGPWPPLWWNIFSKTPCKLYVLTLRYVKNCLYGPLQALSCSFGPLQLEFLAPSLVGGDAAPLVASRVCAWRSLYLVLCLEHVHLALKKKLGKPNLD